MVAGAEVRYKPLQSPARWAMGALVAVAVLDVVAFVSDYLEYDLYDRIAGGGGTTAAEVNAADDRQAIVAFLAFVAFVLTVIAFLRWFHRAYRNLDAVGGHQRYGQGWAIGAWFVPILNLFRPKQIANDIWRGSDPEDPERPPDGTEPVSPILTVWWGAFLVSSWLQNIAGRAFFGGDSPSDIRSADELSMGGDALDLVAALLAVAVIWMLTVRQSTRAAARGAQAEAWSTASS